MRLLELWLGVLDAFLRGCGTELASYQFGTCVDKNLGDGRRDSGSDGSAGRLSPRPQIEPRFQVLPMFQPRRCPRCHLCSRRWL